MRAERKAVVQQALITCGGEMGALIRSHDWAQTWLGPVETWSHSLITALSILLNACSPMFLIWGHDCPRGTDGVDRILFYNDAYSSILQQSNHPILLGQPVNDVWPEDWDSVRSDVEQVFTTGQPFRRENEQFPINRDGNWEGHFYTWSYSAIWDEAGQVGGVFATGCRVIPEETNPRTSEEEHQPNSDRNEQTIRSLLRISEKLNSTLDVDALLDILIEEAINLVNAESGCSGLYTLEGMVCHKYFQKGEPRPLEYCWHLGHGLPGWLILHKVPYLTNDALTDTQIVHELCLQFGVRSALSMPILNTQSEILGFFEIHNKKDGSGFTPSDREKLVAVSQVAAIAIQNALSYQNLQHTEETLRQSEERYQAFIEQSSEAIWRFELEQPLPVDRSEDEQIQHIYEYGYLAECNQMMAQMYGFASAQDILGVRLDAFLVVSDPRNTDYLRAFIRSGYRLIDAESYEVDQWGHPKIFLNNLIGVIEDGMLIRAWGTQRDISDRKQAQQELQRTLQTLSTLIKASPLPIVVIEPNMSVQLWNPAAEQLFGWSEAEVLGQPIPIVPQEKRDECRQVREAVANGEVFAGVETYRRKRDDSKVIVSICAAPLSDEHGSLNAILLIFQDITEQQRAEEALRHSEERFRLSVRAVDGMVYDWDVRAGTVYRSEGLYRLIGIHPENAPTRKDWWGERIQPDDLVRIESVMAPIFQGSSDRYEFEYRVRHEDGYWVDVWDRGYLIRDEKEQLIRVVGFTADITKRKQVEEALRQSEERLRLALCVGKAGIWDWNIPNNRVTWSEQIYEFHGLTPSTFGGRVEDVAQLIHPDDRAGVSEAIRQALEEKASYEIEFRAVQPSGVVRWLSTTGGVIFDAFGHPIRMLGATRDITERKAAEEERERLLLSERRAREEAESANRIKDEFLAVLSHELRSPLNPILGWAKLLQVRKLDEQATQRALETIERNAKLQTQLIEDLLDVSRILRGKIALNVSPVNLVTVIQAAIETVRLAAEAKRIEISVEIEQGHKDRETHTNGQLSPPLSSSPPLPLQIFGDAARLQQVVWNLLSNAIKFTPAGGRVEVSLSLVNSHSSFEGSEGLTTKDQGQMTQYAQIQVKDTGIGIKPDFLPHVFEYFRQEDGTTTRQFGGLGLGLAIVHYLTQLHGGTVKAESPGERLGATFTVRLPLLKDEGGGIKDENGSNSSLIPHPSSLPLTGLRVLVVDDEADMRELMLAILEQFGAQVRVVASAVEALEAFEPFNPDVLISDIGMPEVDGYMLMQQIRCRSPEQGGQIRAIALTAYAGEYDQKQALAAGFGRHIPKPVEPDTLVQAIATLLGRNG